MYAIVDVETTGLRPAADRIIEIAVVVSDGQTVLETFSSLIHPEQMLPPYVTDLTQISDTMLADAPRFYQVAKQLVTLLKGRTIVAHNARFDYSFLKKEFAELGFSFNAPTLCTVRLSRETLPGLQNYRLSTICSELGISLRGAHRALADANATAELFHRLHDKSRVKAQTTFLPPGLSKSDLDALPEETGIYRFFNEKDEIVYVGKSKNIQRRVESHFAPDHKSYKPVFYKNSVTRIEAEVLGSELLALLKESEEIKTRFPPLNSAGKRRRHDWGLFLDDSQPDFFLKLKRLEHTRELPVVTYSNAKSAKNKIEMFAQRNGICRSSFLGVYFEICPACGIRGCLEEISQQDRNRLVIASLKPYRMPAEKLVINEPGPAPHQRALIVVYQNQYRGCLIVDECTQIPSFEDLMEQVVAPVLPLVDAPAIILAWLKKNKRNYRHQKTRETAVYSAL